MKEIYKDIPGYVGYYQASNLGNIKSLNRVVKCKRLGQQIIKERILKPNIVSGYAQVLLSKYGKRKDKKVHRLVAETFIPNPHNKEQVNHMDGNKLNNSLENLEWNTCSENQLHAVKTGLSKPRRGKDNNFTKLTKEQVIEIKKLLKSKTHTHSQIAKIYGVCRQAIGKINTGKNWTWLS